jgi:hypothetical protein
MTDQYGMITDGVTNIATETRKYLKTLYKSLEGVLLSVYNIDLEKPMAELAEATLNYRLINELNLTLVTCHNEEQARKELVKYMEHLAKAIVVADTVKQVSYVGILDKLEDLFSELDNYDDENEERVSSLVAIVLKTYDDHQNLV